MKLFTHGVEVEVEEGTEVLGVIQTTSGTVLILDNGKRTYAVYSPVKSRITHIHVPINFIKYDDDVLEFKDLEVNTTSNFEGLKRVFADVTTCIKNGNCYFDTVNNMLRSVMPVVSVLNKIKYEECKEQFNDEDLCSLYRGAPIRLLDFTPFGAETTTPLVLKRD